MLLGGACCGAGAARFGVYCVWQADCRRAHTIIEMGMMMMPGESAVAGLTRLLTCLADVRFDQV